MDQCRCAEGVITPPAATLHPGQPQQLIVGGLLLMSLRYPVRDSQRHGRLKIDDPDDLLIAPNRNILRRLSDEKKHQSSQGGVFSLLSLLSQVSLLSLLYRARP